MFIKIFLALLTLYVLLCGLLYFFQERLIFFPQKLDKAFRYSFNHDFEELNIILPDGNLLNGLLFKAENPEGLIFYLHGNAGALDSWGFVAEPYLELGYSVFILDYRGYGKSEGNISSQNQLFTDVQSAYNTVKQRFPEEKIVVLGYSIGTGPAAKLASDNQPRLLILQAPFYNLSHLMTQLYPIVPTFILKYKLKTNEYLENCQMPVVLIHGDQDEIIPYKSSVKLINGLKKTDTLITLSGQGHNGMTENPQYLEAIKIVLK